MIKVDFIGNVGGHTGYDECSRALVKALYKHVDLRLPYFGQNHSPGVLSDSDMVFYTSFNKPNRVPDVTIFNAIPTVWRPNPATKNIGIFCWETSRIPCRNIVLPNGMPPETYNWVEQCNKMDEIWTYSKCTVEACKASGVKKPVKLIPGVFDYPKWSKTEPLVPILNVTNYSSGLPILNNKKFIVSYIGEWSLRKNIDSFLKCCLVGLPADKTIILLKSNAPNFKPNAVTDEINKLKAAMKLPVVPPIVLIDELVSDDTIRSILYYSDVYVTLSRGEGFDYPLLQAMAMGKLCVAGLNTAHLDYIENNVNAFGINCTQEIVAYPDDGMNPCHLNYTGDQIWYKPNEIEFIMKIQNIYEEWKKDNSLSIYDKMKKNAQEKVKKLYDIEASGKACIILLRQLCGVS